MRDGITVGYMNWIQDCTRAIVGHLYKFTSLAGDNDYFTDLDWDINYLGVTWKSQSLRIDGMRRKVGVGLEIDEQEMNIYATPEDTIFGGNFLSGVETGVLDGATITRYRAVWAPKTGNALFDIINDPPFQSWIMFIGYASEITRGGASKVNMKVKSPLVKLEIQMPRNHYQPGCLWTLFDSGCTLNKAAFQNDDFSRPESNTVNIVPQLGVPNPIGADGIATFALGRIRFTSGVNDGLLTLISTNDHVTLQLAYPLETAPSPGDTFSYWPGCSKSEFTCDVKFTNKNNYRAFDKVPPISISI